MNGEGQELVTQDAPLSAQQRAEARAVAYEMAKSYKSMVEFYIRQAKKTPEEAIRRQDEDGENPVWIEQIKQTPAREVSWHQFSDLEGQDPEAARAKWEEIKAEARDHVARAVLSADVIPNGTPWNRAVFIAIAASLTLDGAPQNGIEQTLIEQMALSHMRFLHWNSYLSNWEGWLDYETKEDRMPRVSSAEAIERAMNMLDRFNRIFLRTLRALRDLRRYNNPVIVQNAGQVNVAGQQINVAEVEQQL